MAGPSWDRGDKPGRKPASPSIAELQNHPLAAPLTAACPLSPLRGTPSVFFLLRPDVQCNSCSALCGAAGTGVGHASRWPHVFSNIAQLFLMPHFTENPYEAPKSRSVRTPAPAKKPRRTFEILVGYILAGCAIGWIFLPEHFLIFQYPMGRPDVAVGGLAGLFCGVVFLVLRRVKRLRGRPT